jgi:hypothetical protein
VAIFAILVGAKGLSAEPGGTVFFLRFRLNSCAIRKTTLTDNKSTVLAVHRARRSHIANNRERENGGGSEVLV